MGSTKRRGSIPSAFSKNSVTFGAMAEYIRYLNLRDSSNPDLGVPGIWVYEPRVLGGFAPLSPAKVSTGLRDRCGGRIGVRFSIKIEDLRRVVCKPLLERARRKTCVWPRHPPIKICR